MRDDVGKKRNVYIGLLLVYIWRVLVYMTGAESLHGDGEGVRMMGCEVVDGLFLWVDIGGEGVFMRYEGFCAVGRKMAGRMFEEG